MLDLLGPGGAHDVQVFSEVLRYTNDQPKRVMVDVGANIGRWAKYFQKEYHQIFCYEPAYYNIECLQKNTEHDHIDRLLVPSPTLPPATTTNCWRIYSQTKKIRIIVDPAAVVPAIQTELVDSLPDTIEWIFLTHHHHDHIGSATLIRERCGIPIAASKETASRLSFAVDHILSHNDIIHIDDHVVFTKQETIHHSLQVLYTPGHTPGHLCFHHLGERWIVCGDMLAVLLVD